MLLIPNHGKAEKSILPKSDTDVALKKRRHQMLLVGVLAVLVLLFIAIVAIAVPVVLMGTRGEGKNNK